MSESLVVSDVMHWLSGTVTETYFAIKENLFVSDVGTSYYIAHQNEAERGIFFPDYKLYHTVHISSNKDLFIH